MNMDTASLAWAREFLKLNGRFPDAIDYSEEGYSGGQCDCDIVGQCPLGINGKVPVMTDRNCYANQLRDFIALANETPKT